MNYRVRVAGPTWELLRQSLLADRSREQAAFLAGKPYQTSRETGVVFGRILPLPDGAYRVHEIDQLHIDTTFVAPLIKRARSTGDSLAFVHTHPWSQDPKFSRADDDGQAAFVPALLNRIPSVHASLVIGDSGAAARIHDESGTHSAAIQIVGEQVTVERPDPSREAPDDESIGRQLLALGSNDRLIRSLSVGVVGAGGTGSAVCQQLLHLAVRRLLVVDPDVVESSNLNRLLGARTEDVGRAKVDLIARRSLELGARTEVQALAADIRRCESALLLRDCDVVFSCTDTHSSRVVLNQLAFQYLAPVVDVGVRIVQVHGTTRDAVAEVRLVGPGRTCLVCQGVLDPELVAAELMSKEDRDEYRRRGYVVGGIGEPVPSLVTMTSIAGTLGVSAAMSWLGALPSRPPSILAFDFLGLRTRRLAALPHAETCPVGGQTGVTALADSVALPCRP